uniref:Eukaryotic translation initiation factor 3 subunit L n=1 Tax=Timema poppense TaxID=170557 RepID=A0A7R9DHW2_TIMPO|nr:unnamed protein product [Timema poppensis]
MYDDNLEHSNEYGYGAPPDDVHGTEGDTDYDRSYYKMPEGVKKFLTYFRNCINEGRVFEIQNLYETTFPKLTEQYFEKRSWPDEADVAHLVDNDTVFLTLYKELYYRHIYARISGGPTLEQRFNSFFNYCDLFNYILSANQPVPLELPDQWLWELIDEFVYQFQSFAQYRARLLKKTPEEMDTLNANNKVWYVLCVLNVLHSLVDKSNIKRQLEVYASGGDPESVAGDFGRHSLYKMLGYFSLVGLLRLHSLLGDYYQAIKSRTYQNDQINKQTDQMYHLLAICLVLHPQCIDESIQQVLREKSYHEKMCNMQYGDLAEFESCFLFACPKFLSPAPPAANAKPDDYVKEAIQHQTQVFMDEAQRQENNWDLDKEMKALSIHLLCFKHKMKNVVWSKGSSGLDGKFQSGSELDFYIDLDMIHIADTKVAHRYGDFFIRKIIKFEELNRKLHQIKI